MNCIVSTYLTSGVDTQRGVTIAGDSDDYVLNWYNSIVSLDLMGVIIHDGLSDEFMAKYPEINFYKVDKKPNDITIYDYRWLCYYQFLKDLQPEKVFFTDLHDVTVVNNPFPEMECGTLYCGDEEIAMIDSSWIQGASCCKKLSKLRGFLKTIRSKRKLLNCGLFGGCYENVYAFLDKLVEMIKRLRGRDHNQTVDMPLFIYTMYNHFGNSFAHGFPINSVFGANEDRDDVWFIHK